MRTLPGVYLRWYHLKRTCFQWDILLLVVLVFGERSAPWPGSLGRDLGDPHTTTDSWASHDCSVSEAGPAAAPDRLPAGVINSCTAKKVHQAALLTLLTPQDTWPVHSSDFATQNRPIVMLTVCVCGVCVFLVLIREHVFIVTGALKSILWERRQFPFLNFFLHLS